jgi:hypothetical protein
MLALSWKEDKTFGLSNFARYHFELLREIGRGDRLHCDELIADDSLQRPSKHDQWNRISLYDC